MIVISDTTVIRYLTQIKRLEILKLLFEKVIIPQIILSEIKASGYLEIVTEIENSNWIIIKNPINLSAFQQYDNRIDKGEKEAIALAIELNADLLLIDDLAGRKLASELHITYIGLVGVLLKAKEKGVISSVLPIIFELRTCGFWVGENFIAEIKKITNE